MNILTCEQVSDGHPDKICDQIADAIVTDCLRVDKNTRAGIEVMIKDNYFIIAGELTSKNTPNYRELVYRVFDTIGWDRSGRGSRDTNGIDLTVLVYKQSNDIAIGVDIGGAGDQGIVYGYATNETKEYLPIPFVLATELLQKLKELNNKNLKADAKAQVSYDYDTNKITTFLCSVQHTEDITLEEINEIVSAQMKSVAEARGLNTDFQILVNPTGRFVEGSTWADCGVTGRKLACDTYGSIGHIGGGALSGKDPTKVDRSGAYIARKIAKDIVKEGYADKCEIQIGYAIGVIDPISIHVDTFGTGKKDNEFLLQYIKDNYDLSPQGIIIRLNLSDVNYNRISAFGQFGRLDLDLPWEADELVDQDTEIVVEK